MTYLQPESEPDTDLDTLQRQQAALQSVGELRDELAATAPGKLIKGVVLAVAGFIGLRWLLRR